MTEKTEAQTEQSTVADQQESVDLTIQDLAALKSIIDISAQRGAFKPNEMAAVGTVYNKLTAFLEAVNKQNQAQQAEQPQG